MDGKVGEKIKSWFGFTLYLVVDAKYELPVAFNILPASVSERSVARKMVDQISNRNPDLLKRCRDREYDDNAMISKLWGKHDRVVYDQKGCVYCIFPDS